MFNYIDFELVLNLSKSTFQCQEQYHFAVQGLCSLMFNFELTHAHAGYHFCFVREDLTDTDYSCLHSSLKKCCLPNHVMHQY